MVLADTHDTRHRSEPGDPIVTSEQPVALPPDPALPPNPYRALVSRYLWRASAFLATDAVMGLAGLGVLTMLGAAVCLAPAGLVGVPLVILAGWALHLLGDAERYRWAAICELDVPAQPRPPLSGPLLASVAALARSRSSWRLVAYFAVLVPWSLATLFGIVLVCGAPLALVLLPTYYTQLPSGEASLGLITVGDLGTALRVSAVTLLLWPPSPRWWCAVCSPPTCSSPGLCWRYPVTSRSPSGVEYLTESRARVVDAAEAERRRIEHDLHDGAQQRLVAMAMTLGRARSRRKARARTRCWSWWTSRASAQEAITELRNLTRGLHRRYSPTAVWTQPCPPWPPGCPSRSTSTSTPGRRRPWRASPTSSSPRPSPTSPSTPGRSRPGCGSGAAGTGWR
ncbi:sensor domain-containing protein [Streptomyces olivaceoviridis]